MRTETTARITCSLDLALRGKGSQEKQMDMTFSGQHTATWNVNTSIGADAGFETTSIL